MIQRIKQKIKHQLPPVDRPLSGGYTDYRMAGQVEQIREAARRLGFDLLGIAAPRPPARDLEAYRQWLARGEHAGMAYMAREDRVARREDPSLILPGVRAVVCVAVNYYPGPVASPGDGAPRGRVSNYAYGEDYHDWALPRLEALARFIAEQTAGTRFRTYVDTGPLLERALAVQAGLGFVGKNTCLIHPRLGSWLFLGEILLDTEIAPTGPAIPPRCGTCTRCLDACPTGALYAPYRLDGRRCISYLTIEHKGPIPDDLRPSIGTWLYGCDRCQEVCPWQRFARQTAVRAFRAQDPDAAFVPLIDLMALDDEGFRRRFARTPIRRIGRGRLLRNAAVVLGNLGDPRAVPALERALDDADPLVRSHAAWALGRIGGHRASQALSAALQRESDPVVRQELVMALNRTGG